MRFWILYLLAAFIPAAARADGSSTASAPCWETTHNVELQYSGYAADTATALDDVNKKINYIENLMKQAEVTSKPQVSYSLDSGVGMPGGPGAVEYSISIANETPSAEAWPKLSALLLKDKDTYQVSYSYQDVKCDSD